MKLSQDFIEAVMMLAFIILVLVGTTDFENPLTKEVTLIITGIVAVGMVVLKLKTMRTGRTKQIECFVPEHRAWLAGYVYLCRPRPCSGLGVV